MKLTSSTVRFPETVTSVRLDYIIALVPVILWSFYRFGVSALMLIVLSVGCAVVTEFALKTLVYKKPAIPDLYSIYAGAIFALTLYSGTSWQFAAIGGALTSLIFRMIGSKGQCFIFAPFAARLIMTSVLADHLKTPVDLASEYLYISSVAASSTYEFILGTVVKAIGSVSALAVILGALYLLLRNNTNRITPVSYMTTLFLLMFFFPFIEGRGMESAMIELFSGEALFIFAFVMTDFSWSPRATSVKCLSGILSAALCYGLIREGMHTEAYYLSVVAVGFISFIIDKLYFTLKYKNSEKGES